MLVNCSNADAQALARSGVSPPLPRARRFAPNTKAFALFAYSGNMPHDLPLNEGEEIKITELFDGDPNWLIAMNSCQSKGLVPVNYIAPAVADDPEQYPWFHGDITRAATELQLTPRTDGLFLVRRSANHPGDLTLSVVFSGNISHYRVQRVRLSPRGHCYYTIDNETRFYPLESLILHYTQGADGLCCSLRQPVPKRRQPAPAPPPPPSDVQLKEVLGRGEFGEVRKGIFQGREVAVKCLSDAAANTDAVRKAIEGEANLMKRLTHPNLVGFIDLVTKDGQLLLITEFMSLGSLLNYLRSRGQSVITQPDQLGFAIDTAKGMSYLASKKLVHRDLAARNVLLDKNCTAKVADFGLAKSSSDTSQAPLEQLQPERIPLKWTAPECVADRTMFSTSSDVWSFGVLLWEIFSFGRMPYPRIRAEQVHKHVLSGYRMEKPDKCPEPVHQIMRDCWQENPSRRPEFSQLVQRLSDVRPDK